MNIYYPICMFFYVCVVGFGGFFNQKLVILEFKRSHNQKCLGKAELLEKKPHRHVKNMQTAHRRRLSWIKLSCCEAAAALTAEPPCCCQV